jgi:hypothetical protein
VEPFSASYLVFQTNNKTVLQMGSNVIDQIIVGFLGADAVAE